MGDVAFTGDRMNLVQRSVIQFLNFLIYRILFYLVFSITYSRGLIAEKLKKKYEQ